MKFGELELYILSDGTHTEDGGGMFEYFPKDIWANYIVEGKTPYNPDEHNNISMAANCLFIKHPEGKVLVETGVHDKTQNYVKYQNIVKKPSLMESMNSAGIKPSDVDIVINSHLNPDHIGWNTVFVNGKFKPAFENAKYVTQKREFKTAVDPGFELKNDYLSVETDVVPLEESGNLELINGEKEVLPGIFIVPTPGHTRGHQSVVIKAEPWQKTMLYAADMAAMVMNQEKPRCKMAFDVLGREKCWMTKKELLYDKASENGWFTYFYHETSFSIGIINKITNAKGEIEYKVRKVENIQR
jgi:glyoxylase-like metal-dependent hydrolase (beta-lactamase superfamily II)